MISRADSSVLGAAPIPRHRTTKERQRQREAALSSGRSPMAEHEPVRSKLSTSRLGAGGAAALGAAAALLARCACVASSNARVLASSVCTARGRSKHMRPRASGG